MKHAFGKTVVVALGGSVVHPDAIDVPFLRHFQKFLQPFLRKGHKFVIVVGGGRLARLFQDAAHRVSRLADEDKDWLGIHSTRLNAHLLRTIFRKIADPVIVDEPDKVRPPKYSVTIASGWRPGWSTDYIAVAIAEQLAVKEVIIAGKPAYVFDKDPHKWSGAKPFRELSWPDYRKLIPSEWKPGLHSPVDPVAAKLAHKREIDAVIINGRDLKNFTNLLNGKKFEGTIIR